MGEIEKLSKGYIVYNLIDPDTRFCVGSIEYGPGNDFVVITDDSRTANRACLKISVLPQVIGIIENLLDRRE